MSNLGESTGTSSVKVLQTEYKQVKDESLFPSWKTDTRKHLGADLVGAAVSTQAADKAPRHQTREPAAEPAGRRQDRRLWCEQPGGIVYVEVRLLGWDGHLHVGELSNLSVRVANAVLILHSGRRFLAFPERGAS